MEISTMRMRTRDITYIAVFTALLAICSWIAIPTPTNISFTLQTLGVLLALGVLGGRRGTLAVLVYLLLGAIGIPVLADFSGGIGAFATPSGGYLIGFIFTALVMWGMEAVLGKSLPVLGISMVLGIAVCYVFGTAWFLLVYAQTESPVGLMTALAWCVLPYLVPEGIKIFLALSMSKVLREHAK